MTDSSKKIFFVDLSCFQHLSFFLLRRFASETFSLSPPFPERD